MKIKFGRFLSSRTKEYVWMRLGDVGEYDSFLSPYDAGLSVGSSFPPGIKFGVLSFNYVSAGVEISPEFTGRNYISIYWGDKDAQWRLSILNLLFQIASCDTTNSVSHRV